MNRREFIKGAATAGALATARAASAKSWRDYEVADGKYWLQHLAGEPMLAAVSETSVAVSWAVGRLATGGVEIADNPKMENARYVKAGMMPVAELSSASLQVRIDGLKPATRYWYRTVTEEVKSIYHPLYAGISPGERAIGSTRSFMTSGAAAESRFGVLNDTHAQWDSFSLTAKKLHAMKFPVCVWAGDALNCTEDRKTAVEAFLWPDVPTKGYAAETPILFVPGNHEYYGEYVTHLDEVMPCRPLEERGLGYAPLKWNFAVRQGDIALIGMDTGEGHDDGDERLCGLGMFAAYRDLQARWLAEVLERPEIKSAPFAVMFCHIPPYDKNLNDGRGGLTDDGLRWGPLLDRHGVQLVVCGHEHTHRWAEDTGYRWKQVIGGGPELGYGAGFRPKESACPTVIEGVVESGKLVVRVHDAWRGGVISSRTFECRG